MKRVASGIAPMIAVDRNAPKALHRQIYGKRDEVIENILNVISNMPGCLSYVVAKDVGNADAIWISEVWDSKASHEASLSLSSVKAAIAKNLPLIAGFGDSIITLSVGGHELTLSKGR